MGAGQSPGNLDSHGEDEEEDDIDYDNLDP